MLIKNLKLLSALLAALLVLLALVSCAAFPADLPENTEAFAAAREQSENEPDDAELARRKIKQTKTGFGKFTTIDSAGEAADQTIFAENKLTMVNVWATFCSPCINEMPDLAQLSGAFDDFAIIGIVSDVYYVDDSIEPDDGVDYINKIVKHSGANYRHLLLSESIYDNTPVGKAEYVPTTFFVDSDGNIIGKSVVGSNSKKQWQSIIKERLALVK